MKLNKIKENWYRIFFNKYYFLIYSQIGIFSPIQTNREIKFIINSLNLPKGSKILDIPCGQGRHSIELARKRYKITGVDLSKHLLNLAKKSAKKEKVDLYLINKDIRKISFNNEFDAAINWFSSFGYFRKEDENLKVLKNINKSLKPSGKFLLDLLNSDWFFKKISKSPKKIWWKAGGNYILLEDCSSDKNKIMANRWIIIDPSGKIKHTYTFMKLYNLSKIKQYLKRTGFKILKVYGDYQGNKFTSSSPRMIILTQKIK